MRPQLYLFCIVSLFVFATCKKDAVTLNQNYIPVNNCHSYYNDSFPCCLDSVLEDYRCPLNTVCIWEGIAVVRFKVNTTNTVHTITLATGKFQSYVTDTTIAGFRIELVNLSQQIEATKPFEYKNYVAEIKVTRL